MTSFLATGDGRPLTFEQVPFDHPVFILYSSGTTGVPKCIVHCVGVSAYIRIRRIPSNISLSGSSTERHEGRRFRIQHDTRRKLFPIHHSEPIVQS